MAAAKFSDIQQSNLHSTEWELGELSSQMVRSDVPSAISWVPKKPHVILF